MSAGADIARKLRRPEGMPGVSMTAQPVVHPGDNANTLNFRTAQRSANPCRANPARISPAFLRSHPRRTRS
jgi:hypothetical protein